MTDSRPTPRTEAGKRLLARQARYEAWHPIDGRRDEVTDAILAIEAEAAQQAPTPEGLRKAVEALVLSGRLDTVHNGCVRAILEALDATPAEPEAGGPHGHFRTGADAPDDPREAEAPAPEGLRALSDATTPGPWWADSPPDNGLTYGFGTIFVDAPTHAERTWLYDVREATAADSRFVVALVNWFRATLAATPAEPDRSEWVETWRDDPSLFPKGLLR